MEPNQFTIRVQQVGVFTKVAAKEYGHRRKTLRSLSERLGILIHTTVPTKAWTSPASSVLHLPSGILYQDI